MACRWTPYTILLIAAAVFSLLVAFYVWRYRRTRTSRVGSLILLAGAVWIAGYALELASVDLPSKLFWAKVKFLSISVIPTGWLSYALLYTGRDKWLARRHLILLSVVPLAFLLLILTNDAHGLVWRSVSLDAQGPFLILHSTYGIGLWVYAAYAYTLSLAGILLLVQAFVRSGRLYGWRAVGLILAVLAPWLVNGAMDLLGWNPLPHLELTPLVLGISIPIMAWGFDWLRRQDLVLVARDTVLEGMQDGILVLDAQEHIVDLNQSAQHIIDHERAEAIGQPIGQIWPAWLDPVHHRDGPTELGRTVTAVRQDRMITYDVRISALTNWRGQLASQVVVLHDITALEQRTTELSTLLEATQALASTPNLDEVLPMIAEKIVQAVNAGGCTIFRWDRGTDTIITWIEHQPDTPQLSDEPRTTYDLSGLPTTRAVLETRQPIAIRAADPDADPAEVAQMEQAGTVSLLMLPLIVTDSVIGLIKLNDGRDRDFASAEIRICQALANQAAVAIENAQLYEDSRRRMDELSTLSRVGIALSSSLDTQAILDTLAHEAVRLLDATSAYVCRWDETQQTTTVITEHYSSHASPEEQISDMGICYAEDAFIPEQLRRGHVYTLHASDPDLPLNWRNHLKLYGGQSVLFLPLASQRGARTYLEIWESRYDRTFTENEVLLSQNLVSQAAVALDNAHLYAEAQQRLQEQIALRKAGAAISSALDLQTVLAHIAEEMGKAIDVTSAYISSYEPETLMATVVAEYIGPQACAAEQESDLGAVYEEDGENAWLELMQAGKHDISHIDQPDMLESERAHMLEYGVKTILYIPLRVKGELIGYVEMWESRRKREFTPEEISLCHSIAQYAAIALENAQLYEQAQQEIAERKEAEERVKASLREKVSLLQEIHHRVKNNLQIISSLLSLQSRRIEEPAILEVLSDSKSRIRSMALVHEKLYQSTDLAQVDFGEYVHSLGRYLFRSYVVHTGVVRLTVSVNDIFLDIDTAIPCGLMINELITNSLKHAFPNGQEGEIRVALRSDGTGHLILTVSDDGIGLPEEVDFRNSPSLGLQLVNSLVIQLDGTIELDRGGGTTFNIAFPTQEDGGA